MPRGYVSKLRSQILDKQDVIPNPPKTDRDIIRQFFKLVQSKKFSNFEKVFDPDAVVREPFSQAAYLHGRSEILPFLQIVLSPNNTMQSGFKVEKISETQDHKMAALVSLDPIGNKSKCQLIFDLNPDSKKIRRLEVQLIR